MRKLSDEEIDQIGVDCRQAKDKGKNQIDILNDLNDCSRRDILDALGLDDVPKKKQRRSPHSYDDTTKKQLVKAVLLDGDSVAKASERFGVSYLSGKRLKEDKNENQIGV